MAGKSVLSIGIPWNSAYIAEPAQPHVRKQLEAMEADVKASPFDWEVFYCEPHIDPEVLAMKISEKEWDCIMVGVGVRTVPQLTEFVEQIVNMAHERLPKAKFAFSADIVNMQAACRRVLGI